jgi:hypothetical protein
MQRDDRVAGVVLAAEQTLQVEPLESGLDLGELCSRFAGRLLAAFLGDLQVDLRVLELGELLAPAFQRRDQRRALAQDRLRLLPVAPEIGRRRRLVQLPQTRLSPGDVKDTSRTRSGGLPGSRRAPSAHSARST